MIDMYGAILGDMVGAPYEFDRGDKTKDFEMWNDRVMFTDDTVMTIAVAEALMDVGTDAGEQEVKAAVVKPGMLVTDEPGYYRDGSMSEGEERGFGIRIENTLLVVKAEHEGFLKFEPPTLVPIDKTAFDSGLLSEEEIGMINDYHAQVYERMKDYFDEAGRKHLERRCEPL